jgi:hypothetical protein
MMIEGTGSRAGSKSGSIPLTSGSGSQKTHGSGTLIFTYFKINSSKNLLLIMKIPVIANEVFNKSDIDLDFQNFIVYIK